MSSEALISSPFAEGLPPAPTAPPLRGAGSTDVAIIGAGYTGLSTALHLKQKGIQAVVLDAVEPGYGGSGRSGGQVIPGLKHDPDELLRLFGPEGGETLIHTISQTVEDVAHLIDVHQISCDFRRSGWIQAAHDAVAVRTVHRRAEQWAKRGVPVRVLERAGVSALIGTELYHGGWVEPRAANLNPLAYHRGLLRATLQAGVPVHGQSRVVRLVRSGTQWTLHTDSGASLTADKVVLATNGYTDGLWPGLRQTLIAANSFQVATDPLNEAQRKVILPEGQSVSDTRRVLRYFRVDGAGRLIMGGRGPFREPRGPGDFAHLDRSIAQMFPQLAHAPITWRWGGRVALTRDFLPHLHTPAPGVVACLGYNGRGVGMASTLGRLLADWLVTPEETRLPLPFTSIQPIPVHGLHTVYVSVLIAWYRFLDALGIG